LKFQLSAFSFLLFPFSDYIRERFLKVTEVGAAHQQQSNQFKGKAEISTAEIRERKPAAGIR